MEVMGEMKVMEVMEEMEEKKVNEDWLNGVKEVYVEWVEGWGFRWRVGGGLRV